MANDELTEQSLNFAVLYYTVKSDQCNFRYSEGVTPRCFFGWETPATDPEYARFLTQYLTAFLALAREEGIENDLLFYISDEPHPSHTENYANALHIIEKTLSGKRLGDALITTITEE